MWSDSNVYKAVAVTAIAATENYCNLLNSHTIQTIGIYICE